MSTERNSRALPLGGTAAHALVGALCPGHHIGNIGKKGLFEIAVSSGSVNLESPYFIGIVMIIFILRFEICPDNLRRNL